MADNGGGNDNGDGNTGGAGGAGNNGIGAGGTGSAGAGNNGAGGVGGAGVGGAGNAAWYSGASPETMAWMETKGYKVDSLTPEAALKMAEGHRNAEKLIGVDSSKLLRLPDDSTDSKGMADFYNKLGRPAEAKGYELEVPDGVDGSFAEWAKGKFHELGLTAKQGTALSKEWNAYMAGAKESGDAAQKAQLESDYTALKSKWGAATEKNELSVDKGAAAVGIDADTLVRLRNTLGVEKAMNLFMKIGEMVGEDKFVDSRGGIGQALSPDGARARINALKQDREWTAGLIAGNADKKAEWNRLHEMLVYKS